MLSRQSRIALTATILLVMLCWEFIGEAGVSADEPAAEREVIFLLDVSASMPFKLGDGPDQADSFDEVISRASARARAMLEPYRSEPGIRVSFYRFGDIVEDERRGWRPDLRVDRENLAVGEAITYLDDFFLPERDEKGHKNYTDNWTYVAASVYELASRRLGLEGPCAPVKPAEDKPLLTLFALTDVGKEGGGEDAPTCQQDPDRCRWAEESDKRIAWLARSQLANVLSYTHWDMGNDNVVLIPPDEAVYRVSWVGKKKGQFNLSDPSLDLNQSVGGFEPHLRMVPEAAQPTEEFSDNFGELICRPRRTGRLASSPASSFPLDVEIAWNARDGAELSELLDGLKIRLPAREVVPGKTGPMIRLDTLRASIDGNLELFIPGDALDRLELGDHSLRMTSESLCDALTRSYPNSTFLLPPDLGHEDDPLVGDCLTPPPLDHEPYDLAPLASIGLAEREVLPVYTFKVRAEGIQVDAPVRFSMDRWWRANPVQTREIVVSPLPPPNPPEYAISYQVELTRDGEPLDHGFDDVMSFGGRRTRVDDVEAGRRVELEMPGRPQRWWTLGGSFPSGKRPGTYQAQLCIEPRVEVEGGYEIQLVCEGCEGFEQAGLERGCITIPVEIGRRPVFSWWRIAILTMLAVIVAFVVLRWHFRKRFPPDLVVGTNECCLRYEHEENPRRRMSRRIYSFKHALADNSAGPVFYMDISPAKRGSVPGIEERPTQAAIGIRALRQRGVCVWAARLPAAPEDQPPYSLHVRKGVTWYELRPTSGIPNPRGKYEDVGVIRFRVPGLNDSVQLELRQGGMVRQSWVFRRRPTRVK